MRFKLRQMEVFRAVMLTGSMSGAAKLLNVTQPAVSRLVAYTEQSLRLRLFDRVNGKLVPTAEAQLLITEVEKLYEGALGVDELARELAKHPGGTLNIAASPSLALHFIPSVIAQFLKVFPDVQVRYHTTFLSDMARELLARQASLAISVLPVEDPGVKCDPLTGGEMVCLVPVNHPLEPMGEVSLADIGAYPLVMYDRTIPFGRLINRAFETAFVTPNIITEVPRAELAIAMVQAGIGLAIVDEFAVSGDLPPGVKRIAIRQKIEITLSLLQSRFGPPQGQNARAFIDMLHSHIKARRQQKNVRPSGI